MYSSHVKCFHAYYIGVTPIVRVSSLVCFAESYKEVKYIVNNSVQDHGKIDCHSFKLQKSTALHKRTVIAYSKTTREETSRLKRKQLLSYTFLKVLSS